MTKAIHSPDQRDTDLQILYNKNEHEEEVSDETQRIICPNCSAEMPLGTHFCSNCGMKLEDASSAHPDFNVCPECSAKVPLGTHFCTECGAKVQQFTSPGGSYRRVHCPNCSVEIPSNLKFCTECGARIPGADGYQPQEKNPLVAGGLSFILAGIGQIYNGQVTKGVILVLASLICIWISGLLYLILWIFGMYDAYTTAQKINEGEIVD